MHRFTCDGSCVGILPVSVDITLIILCAISYRFRVYVHVYLAKVKINS